MLVTILMLVDVYIGVDVDVFLDDVGNINVRRCLYR